MTTSTDTLLNVRHRVNWVRLRTLIRLRWFAIAGQIAALVLAPPLFDLTLELGLAFAVVGASVAVNLIAILVYPENKRLREDEMVGQLLFDILQLGLLLYLTGGLNNPFALLMLGPVTVSASALRARTTAVIGAISIALVTFLAVHHLPLDTPDGVLAMREEVRLGFWVALVIGIVFLSIFAQRVTSEVHAMSDALAATQMALDREQKLTDLGGVVAAAAHELGTPLATIKLVSSELLEELADRPDLREDVELVRQQADRCRDILRSMGRAGKDDLHLKQSPIGEVIREAAEPHTDRGISINYDIAPAPGADPGQPLILRRPEIIHGLRNLIQNAVDFAREAVWIDVCWTGTAVSVRIVDDGPGYPADLLGRLGEPFLRARLNAASQERPGYEGMGLGLFIAKTLLERSGAEMSFANGRDALSRDRAGRNGAIVDLVWPASAIVVAAGTNPRGLGDNRPFEAR